MNELDFTEITKLNEKFSKEPKSRIFVQLADLYRKNNMIDEALDVLNKGFEFHPQYPVAYLILGKCYYDKRSYIQARDAFEKTIAFDPQNIVALRMLAKTCETLKDEKGQINAYKSIIAIDPLDTNAKEKLSMLEALQRKEPMYTVAMAEEYENQGNEEEALQIYEHLLYTDPSDLILKQKVAELKTLLSHRKSKIEEEKIEEMKVEPVFKSDELVQKEEPEKLEIETFDRGGQPARAAAGDSEIQSLEDFLVEELEQAAEKKAAQKHEEEGMPTTDDGQGEELVFDTPFTEGPTAAEPIPTAHELITDMPDDSGEPKAAEANQVEPEKAAETPQEAPEEPAEAFLPEAEREQKALAEESSPAEEPPAPTEKTLPVEEQVALTDEGTQVEEPERPVEMTQSAAQTPPAEETTRPMEYAEPTEKTVAVDATKTTESVLPTAETQEPEKAPATEKPDDAGKKEEPKKPKEEDFKSFQEWLSGLLK
jgi:tetratricopeptide (TPR) repeat protein